MRFTAADLRLVARLPLRPIQFVLRALSGLVPRREDLWVFGSWGGYRFADNAAAFFLYCDDNLGSTVDLVWISRSRDIVAHLRNQGFEAHWVWSPRGIARSLRAGVHLSDCFSKDINHWLARGAKRVNLWSGVPLKTFERDIDNPNNRYYRLFHGTAVERAVLGVMMPWHLDRPDLIIATSEETAAITRRAFDVPTDDVVVTGFPRNDALVNGLGSPAPTGCPPEVTAAHDAGKPTFLYLPTFRDSGKDFVDLDWVALDALMEELDATLFVKFHPIDSTSFDLDSPRIVQLDNDIDVYAVLPKVTALVSDYSSIIFDYMLLERPIVYYVPDLEEFMESSRSLYFDPRELAIGPVCRSTDDLGAALAAIADGRPIDEPDDKERERIVARLHTHPDGKSSARVLEAIEREILVRPLGAR